MHHLFNYYLKYKLCMPKLQRAHGYTTLEVLLGPSLMALVGLLARRVGGGNSLAVQWLGLHAFTAGGTGLSSGWGTKIPQVMRHDQEKKTTTCTAGLEEISLSSSVQVIFISCLLFLGPFLFPPSPPTCTLGGSRMGSDRHDGYHGLYSRVFLSHPSNTGSSFQLMSRRDSCLGMPAFSSLPEGQGLSRFSNFLQEKINVLVAC